MGAARIVAVFACFFAASAPRLRAEAPPCSPGAERNPEKIREFLWRLANLEQTLGIDAMMRAYGAVDTTEHAVTTDDAYHMARMPRPLPTDAYPFDQVVRSGGVFLPEGLRYNETVCVGEGIAEVDMRWFLQGYLSGPVSGAVKEVVGKVYNAGKGYGETEEGRRNAEVNMRSLRMGRGLRAGGKNLEAFARAALHSLGLRPEPPAGSSYKEWHRHVPVAEEAVRAAMLRLFPDARVRVVKEGEGRFRVYGCERDGRRQRLLYGAAERAVHPAMVEDRWDDCPASGAETVPASPPAGTVERRNDGRVIYH